MNWFIVVYFLVNGAWIEAEKLDKEGWSSIVQSDYYTCLDKINESNARFKKIADYREIELDIIFKCECKKDVQNPDQINCKERNWIQKIYDKIFLINK